MRCQVINSRYASGKKANIIFATEYNVRPLNDKQEAITAARKIGARTVGVGVSVIAGSKKLFLPACRELDSGSIE